MFVYLATVRTSDGGTRIGKFGSRDAAMRMAERMRATDPGARLVNITATLKAA